MSNSAFAFEKALKNKTKKEVLVEKLIDMLKTGLLREGDLLPSERELAQLFEVSRETVRGALAQMAAYDLISVSQGSKTRISADEHALSRFTDTQEACRVSEMESFDLDCVFESRIIVEAAIARRAAIRIDMEGIQKLERLLDAQSKLFDSPVYFQLSDQSFHKLISEYANNSLLLRYAQELYGYGLSIRRQVMVEDGAIERSYGEHARIVDALKRGDPDAAERAMLAHLDSVYRTTKEKSACEIDKSVN
ncbi:MULTISPECIES: FadR/GntR family transcriptional regulator [Halomonas]|uniref:Transcriptional regulator, GntR family n=1 Tax=Halomonas citrativorans TaxID=2742612 RepID=A0A1R4I4S6_9GAMM|nr:FCD domain-containing protein [Halomonas citrativorans]SJN14778.1 Transcriptional regulator, GntR family [Halomonas citrativorans]